MKQNLLFNQASAICRRLAMVLTMLLTIGIGTMWGATVTYTVSSTTSVTKSGTAPIDATASYKQTYSTAKQLTKNNSATLTLTNLGGINISNLTLSMKSNGSSGSGKLSYSIDDGSTWTYLVGSSSSGLAFSHANWNGMYTTSYTNISKDVTINNATQLKIKIEATVNSLYCESYTITYTDAAPKQEYTLSYQAGENNGALQVEEGANLLDALGELGTPTSCDATSTTFVGWTTTEITEKTNTAPTLITNSDVMPSANHVVYAVFAKSASNSTSKTLTLNSTNLSTPMGSSYSSTDFTYSGITFGRSNAAIMSSAIQIKAGTSNAVWNKTALPGAITSIAVTKKTNNSTLTVGTSASPTTNSKTVSSTTTYTFNASNDYRYFKIAATSSYTQVTSVVITYSATANQYTDYITTCTTETVLSLRPQPAYRHSVKNLPFL